MTPKEVTSEGAGRMGSYDNLNLDLCETLYAQGAASVVTPHYTYRHADKVVAGVRKVLKLVPAK